jgi:hypothetical protein
MKKISPQFVIFLVIALSWHHLFAQSNSINNIAVQARDDGSGFYDVYYNIEGANTFFDVSLEVSFDNGVSYQSIDYDYLSGDLLHVNSGGNKHIVWDGLGSFPDSYYMQSKIAVRANAIPINSDLQACYTYMSRTPSGGRWIFNQSIAVGDTIVASLEGNPDDYVVPWCTSFGCCDSYTYNGMSISRHYIADNQYKIHVTGGLSGGAYWTNGFILIPENWSIDSIAGIPNSSGTDAWVHQEGNKVIFRCGLNYSGCVCSDCGRAKFDVYVTKNLL